MSVHDEGDEPNNAAFPDLFAVRGGVDALEHRAVIREVLAAAEWDVLVLCGLLQLGEGVECHDDSTTGGAEIVLGNVLQPVRVARGPPFRTARAVNRMSLLDRLEGQSASWKVLCLDGPPADGERENKQRNDQQTSVDWLHLAPPSWSSAKLKKLTGHRLAVFWALSPLSNLGIRI